MERPRRARPWLAASTRRRTDAGRVPGGEFILAGDNHRLPSTVAGTPAHQYRARRSLVGS